MAKTPNTKLYWLLAFIITIAAAYYQRKTGSFYSPQYVRIWTRLWNGWSNYRNGAIIFIL